MSKAERSNVIEQAAAKQGVTVLEYMKQQVQKWRFVTIAARKHGISRARWYQIASREMSK
jgi:hypothetical protein